MSNLKYSYKIGKDTYTDKNTSALVTFKISELETGIKIDINTTAKITDLNYTFEIPYTFEEDSRFYANGFQSWSYSKEFKKINLAPKISPIFKQAVKNVSHNSSGEYNIISAPKKRGIFNSFSHCYIRNTNTNNILLFGSLSDKQGFSVITANFNTNTITFTKDLDGLEIHGEYNLLDIIKLMGEYNSCFDEYFKLLNINKTKAPKLIGYTSWYNYRSKINEKIILTDLDNLVNLAPTANIFQIDDGYHSAIGDHLSVDKQKFPNGVKFIADTIHQKGLLAGIWLSPLCVSQKSEVFRDHKDWLICATNQKPIKMGSNWGGYYALDIYNKNAREYIKHCLEVISEEWTFDLFKLDFLFVSQCVPRNNKTRGEIMYDTMEFFRSVLPNKLILACGAPLMPCFGNVDYARVGPDITFCYRMPLDEKLSNEMLSTRKTITNTIFRRYLDGRAFLNDPDVFIMREINCSLSVVQRRILGTINKLFGSVLLTSDNVGIYKDTQKEMFNFVINEDKIEILGVNILYKNTIRIDYTINNIPKLLVFDLKKCEIFREQ